MHINFSKQCKLCHPAPPLQGYLWCDGPGVPPLLPAGVAGPWCTVAAALDMPPVLTYSSYNLSNWQRLDAAQPVELGNIVCLHNFLGGSGEHSLLPALLLPLLLVMLPLRGNAAIAVDNDAARACGRAISLPCFCSCATNDCNGLGACR